MSESKGIGHRYDRNVREICLEDGMRKVKPLRSSEHRLLRNRRVLSYYLFLILFIYITVAYFIPDALQIFASSRSGVSNDQAAVTASNVSTLVPLEAHVMSKCPDARDCLRDLVVPAMEQVVDNVTFKLSYIGSIAKDNTVQCKHGSTECLGNMLSLCAAHLFPADIKRSLGFSTCMILSYQRIPARDLVEHCALEHGIPFEDLNACVSEEGKGLDLLEASVQRSQEAGIEKSCTVRVAGKKWCIRDGAEWRDCPNGYEVQDLVQAIQKQHKNS